jgi:ubiquinone/menaquinone biosynthesis C-methylase UbiE
MEKTALGLAIIALGLVLPGCVSFKRWSYEGWGRDGWQKPDEVIQALQVAPGSTVADLGSGGGYFTFRFADAVGPEGRVYAVDVDTDLIDYVRRRSADEGRSNVIPVLAAYDDPKLGDGSVDLLFTCNTYHHIEERTAYFARAARVLSPGGRVAIIDLDGRTWLMRLFGHVTPRDEIVSEMQAAGYRLVQEHEFLPRQSFLVFARGD